MKKIIIALVLLGGLLLIADMLLRLQTDSALDSLEPLPNRKEGEGVEKTEAPKARPKAIVSTGKVIKPKGEDTNYLEYSLKTMSYEQCLDFGKKLATGDPAQWEATLFDNILGEGELKMMMLLLIYEYTSCASVQKRNFHYCDKSKKVDEALSKLPVKVDSPFLTCEEMFWTLSTIRSVFFEKLTRDQFMNSMRFEPFPIRQKMLKLFGILKAGDPAGCQTLSEAVKRECEFILSLPEEPPQEFMEDPRMKERYYVTRAMRFGGRQKDIAEIETMFPSLLIRAMLGEKNACKIFFLNNWKLLCEGKPEKRRR